MLYSAKEVAKRLNISKDTLRYYEREGLLPMINRNKSGHREFSEADIEWIYLIRCLRDTDMPIKKIKKYISLLKKDGGTSISQRRDILLEHEIFIKEKINTYQALSKLIQKKLSFYDELLSIEENEPSYCMDNSKEWDHFRSILKDFKHEQ